ncbi:hypothetical protein [Nonomuraea deserti]|uniref:hypothetical protein n=1 Tax=Nonomuraea deserti TaxID=1848322 RepID=UPI0014046777|nr:hypothetical protein [Nonomuraea deserti]
MLHGIDAGATLSGYRRDPRGAAELLTIAKELRHRDVELELLTSTAPGHLPPQSLGTASDQVSTPDDAT